MHMKKIALYTLLVITTLSCAPCAKQADSKLNGKWTRVKTADFLGEEAIWDFNGGTVTVTYPAFPGESSSGSYKVFSKGVTNYIKISGLDSIKGNFEPVNADWEILKLKSNMLVMAHNTPAPGQSGKGVVLREFVR